MSANKDEKRAKHYTAVEKSYFLQVIDKYKHVIECKKSNVTTLRDKELALSNICEDFNNSSVIMQQRNVHQLKKLWTNLKHSQRQILIKEKQNRFATGGEPEMPCTEVDPEVAAIAPMLMINAPISFLSNMLDHELEDARENTNEYDCENFMDPVADNNDTVTYSNDTLMAEDINPSTSRGTNLNEQPKKRQKIKETEEELKIIRLKNIMVHEERMAKMKEEHLKELNELEIKAASTKTQLAELLLAKEEGYLH